MNKKGQRILLSSALIIFGLYCLTPAARAEARRVEFRFQLSNDAGSEFSTRLPVLSAGSLVVEAEWRPLGQTPSPAMQKTTLTLILLRPNGTEAARTSGSSPLRFEMRIGSEDIGRANDKERASWVVKVINSSSENRAEVAGLLRAFIPITTGTLTDTEFVLLGSGNAKEIRFPISAPGRLIVDAHWQPEPRPQGAPLPVPLSLSLLHLGEDRIYARRQGRSPQRIEQQITEQALDRGAQWVVRIQNDSAVKARGRVRISFTPGL